jgi:uncharacterized protein (TIGR02444 family)
VNKKLSLWEFSCALYAKPQVAETCLRLQDDAGANVNLLLWALWLEKNQLILTPQRLCVAQSAIQQWDSDYVQVLRQLRRELKREHAVANELAEALRKTIKQAELQAEHYEQSCLAALSETWVEYEQKINAGHNLAFYLQSLKVLPENIAQAMSAMACL